MFPWTGTIWFHFEGGIGGFYTYSLPNVSNPGPCFTG
jgi:hypothetical protein